MGENNMKISSEKKSTCYIVGRPDIPQGYEMVVEHELDRLLARGVLNFVFTGMGPFERLCLETLQRLQKCYDYLPIRLTLIGSDVRWLAGFEADFNELFCLCHESSLRLSPSRYAIRHSRFLLYFQQTDFGGAFSDLRYGRDLGLTLVNVAQSEWEPFKPISRLW